MSATFNESIEGWDRTFFRWSSNSLDLGTKVFAQARWLVSHILPKEYDQADSKSIECFKRVIGGFISAGIFLGFGAVYILGLRNIGHLRTLKYISLALSIPLACILVPRILGVWCQKNNYTLVRTQAPEKPIPANGPSIGLQNVIAVDGGYNLSKGGVIDFEKRLDPIAEKFREKTNPTVLVFNEVYDTRYMEQIIKKYEKSYPYIFCHLGANPFLLTEGGVMILSKARPTFFQNTPFKNNPVEVNRTFVILEIGEGPNAYRVVSTHLIDGDYTELACQKLEKAIPKSLEQLEAMIGPEESLQAFKAAFDSKQKELVKQTLKDLILVLKQKAQQLSWRGLSQLEQYLHFLNGGDSEGTRLRKEQFLQIVEALQNRPKMPTLFAADANMEWTSLSERTFLSQYLNLDQGYDYAEPTCTNEMRVRWETGKPIRNRETFQERIDYLAPFKASLPFAAAVQVTEPVELVRGFEDIPGKNRVDSTQARSDHHGLRGRFKTFEI